MGIKGLDAWLTSPPDDEDYPCSVCGKDLDHCFCPECPVCGSVGDPKCYQEHGLVMSWEQRVSLLIELKREEEYLRWEMIYMNKQYGPESEDPTPYAVRCNYCSPGELIYMRRDFYLEQMMAPDAKWICPRCGQVASWDDDNYEERMQPDE